jgi:exopolyphosphatase/pppGpp-phosphohydrolase
MASNLFAAIDVGSQAVRLKVVESIMRELWR